MYKLIYKELRNSIYDSTRLSQILKKAFPKIWTEVQEDVADEARAEYERAWDALDTSHDREDWDRVLHEEAERNCRLAGF